MNSNRRVEILVYTQVALLGEVTPQMRSVDVHWDAKSLLVVFYVDGEPTMATIDSADCVDAELLGRFYADTEVSVEICRIDMPQPIDHSKEKADFAVVYARKERHV